MILRRMNRRLKGHEMSFVPSIPPEGRKQWPVRPVERTWQPVDELSALSPEESAALRSLVRDAVSDALSVQAAEIVKRHKVYGG